MVLFAGQTLAEKFGQTADDTCYMSMPLFHSNALAGGWAPALVSSAAMVPAKFSASSFLSDIRRYGATYVNYVGKPLAYIVATPEQPDDSDNPLRVAFGNEASEKDIDGFSRRFDVVVEDGFGSTENGVIVTREPGTPKGSIGKGFPGVAIYHSETATECPVARFDDNGALLNAEEAIGELVNTQGGGFSVVITTMTQPTPSACVQACTGPVTWPTETPTGGFTSPAAQRTGCASTVRTWPRRRSSESYCDVMAAAASPSTRCRMRASAIR